MANNPTRTATGSSTIRFIKKPGLNLETKKTAPKENKNPTPRKPRSANISSIKPTNKVVTTNSSDMEAEPLDPSKIASVRQKIKISPIDAEPWSQLLTSARSKDSVSSFSNFDPLRTLHFLTKELQVKLQHSLPANSGIHQMIRDINIALKRVPPEIASIIHVRQSLMKITAGQDSPAKNLIDEKPEKLANLIKAVVNENASQTQSCLRCEESKEMIQKIVQDTTHSLETSCKQMELLCTSLKRENTNLEAQLKKEQEDVQFFKSRAKDLEGELKELLNGKLIKIEQEKSELVAELNKMRNESQSGYSELKMLVQELKLQKSNSEHDCTQMKHKLTVLEMEKEKFAAMVSMRDKELEEIQKEVARMQSEISEKLFKLHSDIVPKVPKRSNLAKSKENAGKVYNSTISSISGSDGESDMKNNTFRELPSGDASVSSNKQNSYYVDGDMQSKIKNAFKELIKQVESLSTFSSLELAE